MLQRHSFFAEAERKGVHLEGAMVLAEDAWLEEEGDRIAFDALPTLSTTPNSGIPSWLTTITDPKIFDVLFAPNKGADILGEVLRGNWLMDTAMFPYMEQTGEVSSYGDYSNNGSAGLNVNYPQRQSYLYQTIIQYGEKEQERAGLARIAWAAGMQKSAITVLNKYQNLTYHLGVGGLANYGLINEPSLPAALTPSPKAAGGNAWIKNGVINATANEVFLDIQSLFIALVGQNNGLVEATDPMVLVMSPTSALALTATNSFDVNVYDLLKKNFPKIRFETDPLYGALSTSNPQGNLAGNLVQLIAESVDGQEVGYCAFNEKLRTHKLIIDLSSFKQKLTQGTWGFILRYPAGFGQMVGV
jgi:hypothetical protein